MQPASRDAYRLFHEGAVALAKVEGVGMPVSRAKLDESDREISQQIRELEGNLRETKLYALQRRRFNKNASVNSRDQLAVVLYEDYKLAGAARSQKTGKYALDDAIVSTLLDDIDLNEEVRVYLNDFRRLQKRYKLKGTYIDGLRKEIVNDRVHGFINLNIAQTYRGSADTPNLNNLPTRDSTVAKHIKGAVVPRPGYAIVEIDYSALEVHIAACYHKDPTMIYYLESGYDMHSDMAAECFMLTPEFKKQYPKETKELRTYTKGYYVFAAFYGDYYASIAMNLWKLLRIQPVRKHLEGLGITQLGCRKDATGKVIESDAPGTFVKHIKRVDEGFWGKRFAVYDAWRKKWWMDYKTRGYFHTKTGFRVHGVYKRNEVINSPVQGSAFHCLLQSIIDIQKFVKQRNLGARIIMEIHDSILAEVPISEVEEYVENATAIMTYRLQEKWPWICLDLKTEVEVSEVSWYDKISYAKWLEERKNNDN